MSEFIATSADVQMRRENEYVPIDRETALILSDYLDDIIASSVDGRSAWCSYSSFSEWFEVSTFLADMNTDYAYIWPLTEQRLSLRRICETGDVALGETYQITMEWQVHREDVVDPSYARSFVLMIPHDLDEDPKLLMCQQKSVFTRSFDGSGLSTGINESGYHEVDTLLSQSFYDKLSMGTQYDAEQVLGELVLFMARTD